MLNESDAAALAAQIATFDDECRAFLAGANLRNPADTFLPSWDRFVA